MKVLVACEESQEVCKAFRRHGHEAYSCDIQEPSGGHPEWHILGDVLPLINGDCEFFDMRGGWHKIAGQWDLLIAFPPCTHLTVSGARWFPEKQKDFRQQRAIVFFMQFALAKCDRIAVENPVGIMSNCWKKPSQIIQPYEYGHPTKKRTCLWLKGLPELIPTNVVEPITRKYVLKNGKVATFGVGFDEARDESGKILAWNDPLTAKLRSKTFSGVAEAMATQWGDETSGQERQLNLFDFLKGDEA